MRMLGLDPEYSTLVDSCDEVEWNRLILLFSDANVNQTWAYNHTRSKKCGSIILKYRGNIVAIALVRLIKIPYSNIGFAYVGSGPLWQLKNKLSDINTLRSILVALRFEFVIVRKLYLYIHPLIYANSPNFEEVNIAFQEINGYRYKISNEYTLFLDLKMSEANLRKGLHPNWRYLLKQAEKEKFCVEIGTSDDLLKTFKEIYIEMLKLKKYPNAIEIDKIQSIQTKLPEYLKYTIVICTLDNNPMSGGVFSTIGDTGIYFLGATNREGRKNKASYIVHWEVIKWMKMQGLKFYDLGGVSPKVVPGSYYFKSGIIGKNYKIQQRIGIIEACENPIGKIVINYAMFMLEFSNLIKRVVYKTKNLLKKSILNQNYLKRV